MTSLFSIAAFFYCLLPPNSTFDIRMSIKSFSECNRCIFLLFSCFSLSLSLHAAASPTFLCFGQFSVMVFYNTKAIPPHIQPQINCVWIGCCCCCSLIPFRFRYELTVCVCEWFGADFGFVLYLSMYRVHFTNAQFVCKHWNSIQWCSYDRWHDIDISRKLNHARAVS